MPPTTSRDFQRVALQRLDAAQKLLELKLTLEAQYFGGYVIECSLKALILEKTPDEKKLKILARITKGAQWHRFENLRAELRNEFAIELPREVVRKLKGNRWSTDLRYETGRRETGQTKAFLKAAGLLYNWVQGQMK
jgi:HEPN domain-containing protein